MQFAPNYKEKVIHEVFNLIRIRGLNNETQRFALKCLTNAVNLCKIRRMKYFFLKLKNFQVTSRLGYDLTQSVVILFEMLSFIQMRIQKEAIQKLQEYSYSKKLILNLHERSTYLPWYNEPKDNQITFLNQKKIIAAIKILTLARKFNVLDWKKIKAFRKWQLEDLRNLMEGYRKTNCNLFLSMRNMYLCYVMKKCSYRMDSIVKECFYGIKYKNEEHKFANSKKLMKLSEILMKRSVITNVLSSEEYLKRTYMKKFLNKLENENFAQDEFENKKYNSLRIICYYWKRRLAFSFRKFYLACFDDSQELSSKKVFENRVEFNKAKVILEAKAELINNLFKVLDFAVHRKLRDAFSNIMVDRREHVLKIQLASKNMLSVREAIEKNQGTYEKNLKIIGFQKLKPSSKSSIKLNLVITVLFKKINNLYKKNLRSVWNLIANYQEAPEESPVIFPENNLIEKNIIANQAIVATYLEQRLKEMDNTLHQERKKLGLRTILVKKIIKDSENLKSLFTLWRNSVEKWKLSFKLTILKKKNELETDKKHLSDVLAQLNQMINNDPNGMKPEDSQELSNNHSRIMSGINMWKSIDKLPDDPGLKYLEYIERQNTELRRKHSFLMEIIKIKEKKKFLLVP